MKRYTIDPAHISLDHFKGLTGKKRLLPGRIALRDEMESRFELLKKSGIAHLGDLLRTLGSKQKIAKCSASTGLPTEYLILLKREAGSYLARPFPLSNFPGIPFEYTELLKSKGIRSTKDFFEQLYSRDRQEEMAASTGIPAYRLDELFSLCDLSRITGIGGVFARVVYEAGIRSAETFAQTVASSHIIKYKAIIDKHGYAAGDIGEDDVSYCIDYAKEVLAYDQQITQR